jgi:hypothetical protein
MKQALANDGRLIEATARAPAQATCPHCCGTVTLRGRVRMSDDVVTYYWRHRDRTAMACPGRQRPHAHVVTRPAGSSAAENGR